MNYLIGLMFHEPQAWAQWQRGLIEDYESSTGLWIEAGAADEAIAWGEHVAQALLRHVNHDDMLDWKALGYYCWLEESPTTSRWRHCLHFFQRVRAGEMPALTEMGTDAYTRWLKRRKSE